ncbi:MAG: adenylate/guanylate cyclase domain-containing protein [Polyangiaceae bacterium]|nr:adenylate/guanylate cyclase domain-containing protein [Polyangiaceae bacterium]
MPCAKAHALRVMDTISSPPPLHSQNIMAIPISAQLPTRARLRLHVATLLVSLFTFVYARLVCVHICSLSFEELARSVLSLCVLHMMLREVMLHVTNVEGTVAPARRAYLLSVATWFLTGAAGIALHAGLHPTFPFGSHFKFAIGYWVLGGGIVAQLEYLLFERVLPNAPGTIASKLHERLGRRLVEGYVVFTIAPAFVLLLTLRRMVDELHGEKRYVYEAGILAAGFTAAALATAYAFGRSLRQDSEKLLDAVRKVGEGNFEPGVSTCRPDELSLVAAGINDMASGLLLRERIRDAFGRFVSPEVATEFIEKYAREGLQAELGGKKRDVVILFSDLRDFTPLSESLPPERLIDVLNGYFTEMVGAIRANGGMVDKFIGDAVLAVFGLTDGKGDSATSAVRAALEMQKRLSAYNERLRADGIELKSGIGIHAGEVVAGYLGSAERLEFTVIGHNVNIAARIESHAKAPKPPLLVSEEVAKRVRDAFVVEEVGKASLKGIGDEMKLFTVAGEAMGANTTSQAVLA